MLCLSLALSVSLCRSPSSACYSYHVFFLWQKRRNSCLRSLWVVLFDIVRHSAEALRCCPWTRKIVAAGLLSQCILFRKLLTILGREAHTIPLGHLERTLATARTRNMSERHATPPHPPCGAPRPRRNPKRKPSGKLRQTQFITLSVSFFYAARQLWNPHSGIKGQHSRARLTHCTNPKRNAPYPAMYDRSRVHWVKVVPPRRRNPPPDEGTKQANTYLLGTSLSLSLSRSPCFAPRCEWLAGVSLSLSLSLSLSPHT